MTKKEKIEENEEIRYEEYRDEYQGRSLSVLVDRLNELNRAPGSDLVEIQAIKDLLSEMDSEVDPYAE